MLHLGIGKEETRIERIERKARQLKENCRARGRWRKGSREKKEKEEGGNVKKKNEREPGKGRKEKGREGMGKGGKGEDKE